MFTAIDERQSRARQEILHRARHNYVTAAAPRAARQSEAEAEALRYLSTVAFNQGESARAIELLEAARSVYHLANDLDGEGLAVAQLATILYETERYDEAQACLEEALPIVVASGHRYRQAVVTCNLAAIVSMRGGLATARRLTEEGLRLCREIGDKEAAATSLGQLGEIERRIGDLAACETHLTQSLNAAREIGFGYLASDCLLGLALVCAAQGRRDESVRLAHEAVSEACRAESPLGEARARLAAGYVLLAGDCVSEARTEPAIASGLAERLELTKLAREVRSVMAAAALCAGENPTALALVEGLLEELGVDDLLGSLQPGEVYRSCWKVLRAAGDPRAPVVLSAAHEYLDAMSVRIDDVAMAEAFCRDVPAHAELAAAFETLPRR